LFFPIIGCYSQSSIQLNEFEKAEIEGNVNRMSCMEMAKAEFENVSSNKINNRLKSSNCRYERLDPKSDFEILNPLPKSCELYTIISGL
jgi:hypothetical protein